MTLLALIVVVVWGSLLLFSGYLGWTSGAIVWAGGIGVEIGVIHCGARFGQVAGLGVGIVAVVALVSIYIIVPVAPTIP